MSGQHRPRHVGAEHMGQPTRQGRLRTGWEGCRAREARLSGSGWRVRGYAASTDLPRSLAIACRSIWRTRSAVMPQRAPMSASLAWRPSISP